VAAKPQKLVRANMRWRSALIGVKLLIDMARPNTIDVHPDRDKVIAAIAAGIASNADIARRFGLSEDAVQRYRKLRAPKAITKAMQLAVAKEQSRERQADQRAERKDLDPWISECDKIRDFTWGIAEKCATEAPGVALQAARETRETLKLWAELAGRLNAPGTGGDTRVILLPMLSVPQAQPALPAATAQVEAQDVEFRALPAVDSK
jgi:hypothetical protein